MPAKHVRVAVANAKLVQAAAGWRLAALLRLQIIRLAKSGRDSFRSYHGVLRIICGDDSHLPAGFRMGAYLDVSIAITI